MAHLLKKIGNFLSYGKWTDCKHENTFDYMLGGWICTDCGASNDGDGQ